MTKHPIVLFFYGTALLLLTLSLHAQRYGTTVGARWGKSHYGASIQQRIQGSSTVEGMVLFNSEETVLTALYEYHKPIIFKWKGFNTYIGGGAHFGWYKTDTLKDQFSGIDGIMGIEYKLPLLPFAASLDFKPTYNFNHSNKDRQFQPQFAISIRYVLVTYREQEKRRKKREKEREKERNKANEDSKGIFDIFKKDDDQNKNNNKKDDKQKETKPEEKGLFDIFRKKDDNTNEDKNKNKQQDNQKNNKTNTKTPPQQEKKGSFWDKINIFKKKADD